jgi:peptidyl-prolyl cis-trans isomerase A (cyclophilin A)
VVVHKEQEQDPGYKFDDEFHPSLKHNRPEFWQWLIQDLEPMALNFTSHIFQRIGWIINILFFGHVVEGQDIVDSVSKEMF